MPDDSIMYNFDANYASIDQIGQHNASISEVKDQIGQLFQTLPHVYTGAGSEAVMAEQTKLLRLVDDATTGVMNAQKAAAYQQDFMHQLDIMNANRISG